MFAKILLFIKSMSLAAKITAVAATVVVVGGTTTAVIIVSQNHDEPAPAVQQDEVAQNDQPAETGEQPKEEEQENDSEEPKESEQENIQPSTPQPQPASDPEPEPEPETPKSCAELHNCDYNLNDRYTFVTDEYAFFSLSDGTTNLCREYMTDPSKYDLASLTPVEYRTFYYIDRFSEGTWSSEVTTPGCAPVRNNSVFYNQAEQYAQSKNYVWMGINQWAIHGYSCPGGAGCTITWTWQKIIDDGYALDEEKCAQWGLSCGRW